MRKHYCDKFLVSKIPKTVLMDLNIGSSTLLDVSGYTLTFDVAISYIIS